MSSHISVFCVKRMRLRKAFSHQQACMCQPCDDYKTMSTPQEGIDRLHIMCKMVLNGDLYCDIFFAFHNY